MNEGFEFTKETCPYTFGELLRQLRERYWHTHTKLSQGKLGDQIVLEDGSTIGKNLISLWETGSVLPPIAASGVVIEAIINALLCNSDEKIMLTRAYICDVAKLGRLQRI